MTFRKRPNCPLAFRINFKNQPLFSEKSILLREKCFWLSPHLLDFRKIEANFQIDLRGSGVAGHICRPPRFHQSRCKFTHGFKEGQRLQIFDRASSKTKHCAPPPPYFSKFWWPCPMSLYSLQIYNYESYESRC